MNCVEEMVECNLQNRMGGTLETHAKGPCPQATHTLPKFINKKNANTYAYTQIHICTVQKSNVTRMKVSLVELDSQTRVRKSKKKQC